MSLLHVSAVSSLSLNGGTYDASKLVAALGSQPLAKAMQTLETAGHLPWLILPFDSSKAGVGERVAASLGLKEQQLGV